MTAKPAKKLNVFTEKLSLIGAVVAAVGLIYLFATPKTYQASAKVRVWKSGRSATNELNGNYDPTLVLPGQVQLIRSDPIVDQAIHALGLNELWGQQYNKGVSLALDQSRLRLRNMVDVRLIPKTSILEIQVTSGNREETATIANELAQLHYAYHQAERQGLRNDKISSLKQAWEVQNQKVEQAQARLYELSRSINLDRATNPVSITDEASAEVVQSKRIELEEEYVKQQKMLTQFKAMDREKLEQVLPVVDGKTNVLLMALLSERNAARASLVETQADHGPDTTEMKHAVLVLDELDRRVSQSADASLESMAGELAAQKSALGRLDEIESALKESRKNLEKLRAQNSEHEQATNEVEMLKQERSDLQDKLRLEDSGKAIEPMTLSAEIVESAQAPLKPVSPDGKLALAIIFGGGFMAFLGVLILLLAKLPKSAPVKQLPQ